jgi:hypothetical protein
LRSLRGCTAMTSISISRTPTMERSMWSTFRLT